MSSSLFSQVIDSKQYNYTGNWYRWQGGTFITNLNIPKVQATTGRDTGAIYYRLADSSLYIWSGSQWRQVTGSGGGGSSYTFSNGLTESAGTVRLGGALTQQTHLWNNTFKFSYNLSATDSVVAQTNNAGFRVDRYKTGVANNLIVGEDMYFEVNNGGSQSAGFQFFNSFGSMATYFQDSRTVKTGLQYSSLDTTGWATSTLVTKDYINKRLSALPSGSTSLNNVGTGFDLAVQGTANVKRLATGYGLTGDSTGTTLTLGADTSQLATKARVKHVADSLGYIISGESVAWGTYAQRIAISSPTTGQRFYQTDERIGEWIYGNGRWEMSARNSVFRFSPNNLTTSYLTTSISGSGASFTKTEVYANQDSIYGSTFLGSTGTTSTGSAYIAAVNNFGFAPPYVDTDTNNIYVMHIRLKVDQEPVNGQDFRLFFGGSNYGSGPLSDSSDSRFLFRLSFYRDATNIIGYYKNSNSGETESASLTPYASLINKWVDYVIVYNAVHVQFWINGTKYYETTLSNKATTLGYATPLVAIQKVSGTTAATIKLSDIHVFRATKK